MTQSFALLWSVGAESRQPFHLWWLALAAVVFILVVPLARVMGGNSGKPPDHGGPLRHDPTSP